MIEASLIVSIASVIISIIAIAVSIKNFWYQKNRLKLEYAINQAREYIDILSEISFVSSCIKSHSQILEIVDKVDITAIKNFNEEEMNKIFTETERECLNNFLLGKDMDYKKILSLYFSAFRDIPPENFFLHLNDEEAKTSIVASLLSSKISNLLNTLEYFSMAFNQNISEEKIVYQSLHQSYLGIVKMMYYYISRNNKTSNPTKKYYTNIVILFNRWVEKEKKIEHQLQREKAKSERRSNNYINAKPKIK